MNAEGREYDAPCNAAGRSQALPVVNRHIPGRRRLAVEIFGPFLVSVVLITLLASVLLPAVLVTAMLSLMTFTVWKSARNKE